MNTKDLSAIVDGFAPVVHKFKMLEQRMTAAESLIENRLSQGDTVKAMADALKSRAPEPPPALPTADEIAKTLREQIEQSTERMSTSLEARIAATEQWVERQARDMALVKDFDAERKANEDAAAEAMAAALIVRLSAMELVDA